MTTECVLLALFTGWNHLFQCVNTFFHHKQEKIHIKRRFTNVKVLLLNLGWHPKACWLLGKIWFFLLNSKYKFFHAKLRKLLRKTTSTSEQPLKHPFAVQNTQHFSSFLTSAFRNFIDSLDQKVAFAYSPILHVFMSVFQ